MKNDILIPATQFAAGIFIQDNYQYIQNVKHFLKENKENREEAINNAKNKK